MMLLLFGIISSPVRGPQTVSSRIPFPFSLLPKRQTHRNVWAETRSRAGEVEQKKTGETFKKILLKNSLKSDCLKQDEAGQNKH